MKKTVILLVLLLCLPVWGLAEVIRIVDPDEGGGYHFSTLDAWEDALGNTTTGHLPNDDQIAIAQCRASGTIDTANVDVDGWTTDATRYIKITGGEGAGDFPSDGVYDAANSYVLENQNWFNAINIEENYVQVRSLQILVTASSGDVRGIQIGGQDAGNEITVDSCIIKGVCSGSGAASAIYPYDALVILKCYNTVAYGFKSGADNGFRCMYAQACNTAEFYNCTVYGNFYGIYRGGGTVTAKNCAVGINDDDFGGTVGMDYIVSDDDHSGDCANYHAFPTNGAGDWSLDFATPGTDFDLLATAANLIDDGLADVFDEDDDIIGTARPQGGGWDIGAFERAAAPPAEGGQVIYIQMSAIPLIVIITLVLSMRKNGNQTIQ